MTLSWRTRPWPKYPPSPNSSPWSAVVSQVFSGSASISCSTDRSTPKRCALGVAGAQRDGLDRSGLGFGQHAAADPLEHAVNPAE